MSQTIKGKVPQYSGGLIFVTQSMTRASIDEQGNFSVPVQSNPSTQQVILTAPQGSPYAPLPLTVAIGPGATDISYQASQAITTVGTYIGIGNLSGVATDERGLAIAGSGGGGGTPSGPDTSVQFDDGGAFGGDATMQWDNTAKRLTLGPDESTILPYFQDWFGASPLIITNVSAANQAGVVVEALSTGTLTGIGIVAVGEVTDADHPGSTIGLEADAATDQGTHDIAHLTGASVNTSNNGSGTAALARGLVINTNFNRGGGAITQGIGLDIDNQDEAVTNWAIRTGLGKVQFGDDLQYAKLLIPGTIYSASGTPLPAASMPLLGSRAVVSDATLPTFLGSYVSGGAVVSPVLCTGTDWVTA